MDPQKRVRTYARQNFNEVYHCTLNPGGPGAVRIFLRDRYAHKSPNAAQTESVCAGALGLQLAGDAWYFGERHKKPFIGDPVRHIGAEDIRSACRLCAGTSALFFACGELLLFLCSLLF